VGYDDKTFLCIFMSKNVCVPLKNWKRTGKCSKTPFLFQRVWGGLFSGGLRLSRKYKDFPPGLVPNVGISEEIHPLHLRGRASHESPPVRRVAPSRLLQAWTRGSMAEGLVLVKGECM